MMMFVVMFFMMMAMQLVTNGVTVLIIMAMCRQTIGVVMIGKGETYISSIAYTRQTQCPDGLLGKGIGNTFKCLAWGFVIVSFAQCCGSMQRPLFAYFTSEFKSTLPPLIHTAAL